MADPFLARERHARHPQYQSYCPSVTTPGCGCPSSGGHACHSGGADPRRAGTERSPGPSVLQPVWLSRNHAPDFDRRSRLRFDGENESELEVLLSDAEGLPVIGYRPVDRSLLVRDRALNPRGRSRPLARHPRRPVPRPFADARVAMRNGNQTE